MKGGVRALGAATIGTLVGNGLSLVLPFAVTAWFGAGPRTDAYFFALGAILFLNVVISVAVESAATPYVAALISEGSDAVGRFVRRTQQQGSLVCAATTAVGVVLVAYVLMPLTSFGGEQQQQVRQLLLLLSPLPVLVTWNAVRSGAFYAHGVFGLPTSSVGLRTVFAFAFGVTLRDEMGIAAIALGLVVGELVRILVLEHRWSHSARPVTPPLKNTGQPARDRAVRGESENSSVWRTAGPQVVSMTLSGVSPLVDKTVAISVGVGAVTTLELAQRLVYTPVLLLMSGVGLVLGARWAHSIEGAARRDLAAEYRRVMRAVILLGSLVVLCAVPLAFLLRPLARDLFSISDPTLLAWTFTAAALGIPCALASQISIRMLLAARRTKVMPYLTTCVVVVNLVLDLVLVHSFGLPGIALASALVNLFNFASYGLVARHVLRDLADASAREALVEEESDTSVGKLEEQT